MLTFSLYRKALDELGLNRYCCRRMVLTHVDLITKLLNYNCKYFPFFQFSGEIALINLHLYTAMQHRTAGGSAIAGEY
jgi:hypothetical protein